MSSEKGTAMPAIFAEHVERFAYPDEPIPYVLPADSLFAPAAPPAQSPPPAPANQPAALPLAEQIASAYARGHTEGVAEGREAERAAHALALRAAEEAHRARQAALAEQLAAERIGYLRAVEGEVVRLALAIARRVLRREATLDPLLLTGAVRTALGQLAAATDVRLCVPAPDADLWRETVAHIPDLAARPTVVPDANLLTGECRLETQQGTADLGLAAQLDTIEQGLSKSASSSPPNTQDLQ